MALILRQTKGSPLTIEEMDGNLTYLESNSLLKEFYILNLPSMNNDFIPLTLQDGLVGGQKHYAIETVTLSYNDIEQRWEFSHFILLLMLHLQKAHYGINLI
jgi:hypothetical protein